MPLTTQEISHHAQEMCARLNRGASQSRCSFVGPVMESGFLHVWMTTPGFSEDGWETPGCIQVEWYQYNDAAESLIQGPTVAFTASGCEEPTQVVIGNNCPPELQTFGCVFLQNLIDQNVDQVPSIHVPFIERAIQTAEEAARLADSISIESN